MLLNVKHNPQLPVPIQSRCSVRLHQALSPTSASSGLVSLTIQAGRWSSQTHRKVVSEVAILTHVPAHSANGGWLDRGIEQFRKVVKMADKTLDGGPWTGCVVLFLQSLCADVDLLSLYKNQNGKFIVFKVIKLTLTDSAGGLGGYEILKVHDAEPFLGVEVKFVNMAACKQFLDSYSSRALHQSFSQHAGRLFAVAQECTVETQLKASTNILDLCLDKLEVCLQHIHQSQPERLRDEEIDCLEQQLQTQALGSAPQQTPLTQEESSVPSNCFKFQNKVFEDRMLTAVDIQSFSNGVGRQWKHVGRALGKNCRALKAPAIDNLAYEYEREGLYEQAYQLLTRFIQAEGRAAKLSRLVRALEDCKLTSLAENLLEMQP